MDALHHGRLFASVLIFTACLLVGFGETTLAAAPASATPPSGPPIASSMTADERLAFLAAQQAQLTAADGASEDKFGWAVAISGDTAIVGAWMAAVGGNESQGAAYVFTRSGTTWSLQQKLTAADGGANEWFGHSVAILGDTAVVGACNNLGLIEGQGSAYVFVRSGTTWTQQAKLTAADGTTGDHFGHSVAISGETVLVGACLDDVGANADQGSAYVFTRSSATWSHQQTLTASDGASEDQFGGAVAISGDTAVVGAMQHNVGASANQGSAYVFVRSGTTWNHQEKLTATDGTTGDLFGRSLAVSGETAVVGASHDAVGANAYQGSAYVFTRSGTTWSEQQMLVAADGAAEDFFGFSVALSSDTAVVGAYGDDVGANANQGSATTFTRNEGAWSQQAQITAADGAAADYFGWSVALADDTAVVGAWSHDVGANANQGSTCVFSGAVGKPARPVARSPKGLIRSRAPTFRWLAAAGAATYEVRVYRGSRLIRQRAGIATLSRRFTRLLPRGVWLNWKVRAYNSAGWGAWSNRPSFKVR
jgi:hypothetical protein